jgi:hypothetical protein
MPSQGLFRRDRVVQLDEFIFDLTGNDDTKGARFRHFRDGFQRKPCQARPYSAGYLAHMRGGLFRDRLDRGELVVCGDLFLRPAHAVADRASDTTPMFEKFTNVPWSKNGTREAYEAAYAAKHGHEQVSA